MSEFGWVSIIWLLGALVLAVGALQGRRVGMRKIFVMALAWLAIFLLVADVFVAIAGGSASPGPS